MHGILVLSIEAMAWFACSKFSRRVIDLATLEIASRKWSGSMILATLRYSYISKAFAEFNSGLMQLSSLATNAPSFTCESLKRDR